MADKLPAHAPRHRFQPPTFLPFRRLRAFLTVAYAAVPLLILLAVLVVIGRVLYFVIVSVPPDLVPDSATPDQLNDARTLVVQAVGGIALVGGLYYTGRNLTLNRNQQVTDAFSKAIGQLGEKQASVRIGALYALERIAVDSRRDRAAITEMLIRYIREHTPSIDDPAALECTKSSADVVVATQILVRRPGRRLDTRRLDLTQLMLPCLRLVGQNVKDAAFTYSVLTDSSFVRSKAQHAHFGWSTIDQSSFLNANLRRASFVKANLQHSFFRGSDCRGVNFEMANLSGAFFNGVRGGKGRYRIRPARVKGANFKDATLEGADLSGVDLRKAKGLSADQLDQATIDDHTKLPPDVALPLTNA